MNSYFIIAGLFWAGAFSLYFLFLRSRTFHTLNRGYLLATLFAGMVLPFIQLPALAMDPLIGYLQPVVITLNEISQDVTAPAQSNKGGSLWKIFFFVYITGVVFFLFRIAHGLIKIKRLASVCKTEKHGNVTLIITDTEIEPFSFFNAVYINSTDRENPAILNHEIAHVQGKHSWDIILTQVLSAIHWFNPFLWLYDRALKETHEYIADNRALQYTRKKEYSYMLIGQAGPFFQPQLSNSFHSQTKKRIKMMFRKKSKAYAYVFYPIAVLVVLRLSSFLLVSCQKPSNETAVNVSEKNKVEVLTQIDTVVTFDPETYTESVEIIQSETAIYDKVDMRPILKECEGAGTEKEQLSCSDTKIITYLANTVKFPEGKKLNGKVVLKFLVDQNGNLSKPEIVQSFDEAYNAEVLKAFSSLRSAHEWKPATVDSKAVGYYYQLPVLFRVE